MSIANRQEISDLIVQFDLQSLERKAVKRDDALKACSSWYASSVIASIKHKDGVLCEEDVDRLILSAHSELQRLWEEFFHAQRVANILTSLVTALRTVGINKRLRLVDIGCGIGYVLRWIAAHDILKDDIFLVGVDFNKALIEQARKLAQSENLDVQFYVANAFDLDEPADLFISSGVLHHIQREQLPTFFEQQAQCEPLGFAHFDPQYSWATPVGSFLFHFSRMRTPLARYDGWLSAVRAHPALVLNRAAKNQIKSLDLFRYNPPISWFPLLRTMTGLVGIHPKASTDFEQNLKEPVMRI